MRKQPDTSQLIRLKLAQEYGYGINPATIVTDKVNLLGTGAHPFWRWIQGTGRAPDGLGRIRGNFEKFLVVDGRPVRRYSRKYEPRDIQEDIEALLGTGYADAAAGEAALMRFIEKSTPADYAALTRFFHRRMLRQCLVIAGPDAPADHLVLVPMEPLSRGEVRGPLG